MILVAALPSLGQTQAGAGGQQRRNGSQNQSSGQSQSQDNSLPVSNSSTTTVDPFELTGRVINARTNQPIARALVKLGTRAVMTNHDGVFSFPQVTSSTGMLVPSKQGFYSNPSGNDGNLSVSILHSTTLSPGAPVELMLYPEALIAGVVASATGEGLPNFTVTIRRSTFDENGHRWMQVGTARTDSAGNYRQVLPPGDYSVQARTFGRGRGDAEIYLPVSVPADSTSIADALHVKMGDQVQVNLRPEARRGYVVSITSDSEVARGFPRMTAYNANGLAIATNPTPDPSAPGMFRVVLPNGTYRLAATMQTREGTEEGEAQVTVAGRDVGGVVMHYNATPRIPVEVSVDPGATITDNLTIPTAQSLGLMLVSKVTNGDGVEQNYGVTPGQDKTYGFAVPHGSYHLQARSTGQWYLMGADYGGSNLLSEDLVAGLGGGGGAIRVRISNQTASISGTVTLGDQAVQAFVYMVATMPSANPVLLIRGNLDGSFNRAYIPPGSYRVLATQQRLAVDLRDPATMTRFLGKMQTVTLDPGGKQTLTLEAVAAAEMPQ